MASDLIQRVAITGASGFLGSALTRALRREHITVLRLVRRPAHGADEVSWNPSAERMDGAPLEGVDAVIHLAGENLAGWLWTTDYKARIRESRVRGTDLVARTLAGLARRPRVLVSASAVGFYSYRGNATRTEADPPGTGFLSEVVQAWEEAAEPAREAGIRVVHPRFGVVLHPAGGVLRMALPFFRLGLGARLGSGRQWMSWVSRRDALSVIRWSLERPDLSGPINVASPGAVTNAEFTSALALALHRPAFLILPAPLLKLFLGDLADEALLASTRAVPERLHAAGYQFQDPELRPALERMIENGSRKSGD